MSWRSKIEAQIAQLIEGDDQCPGCLADTMQALLDVAVAAATHDHYLIDDALDKLRELDT